jgi:transcriptional regulator with XRE-family HTH domain
MEELSIKVKQKRGNRGIREIAKDIGISPATLSRIEQGKQPDISTFGKVCKWLGIDPSAILGLASPQAIDQLQPAPVMAHFRTARTMGPETARHLTDMILAIQHPSQTEY